MFVSHQHKFVFVHIPKTGGTSITNAYLQFLFPGQPITSRMAEEFQGGQHKHDVVATAALDDYYWFTFVRNPWDRMLSYYMFRTKEPRGTKIDAKEKAKSFRQWLIELDDCSGKNRAYPIAIQNQADVLGEMPDFIGRYDRIQADFHRVCSLLGLPPLALPHDNRTTTKTRHYSAYYDRETKEIVSTRYKKDIELFGYQFEQVEQAADREGPGRGIGTLVRKTLRFLGMGSSLRAASS